MIYITGDTHGDFSRVQDFCIINNTTTDDLLIILGDVGINYYGGKKDKLLKDKLKNLPITIFGIKGNHENYAENIESYELLDFCQGKVYVEKEYPNLLFPKDGEIFNFQIGSNTAKVIVIGGAYSVDKYYRQMRGFMWFNDEQPSEVTKKYVEDQLDRLEWDIDVVLSHTSPLKYEPIEWFLPGIDQSTVDKSTEIWFDKIESMLRYKKWYCGHYHGEKNIDNIEFVYKTIKEFSLG